MLGCSHTLAVWTIFLCLFATSSRSQIEAAARIPPPLRTAQAPAETVEAPAKKERKSDADLGMKPELAPSSPASARKSSLDPKSGAPKSTPSAHLPDRSLAKSTHKAVEGLGKDGQGTMGYPSVPGVAPHATGTASDKAAHHPATDAEHGASEDEPEHHLHHTHHEDPCAKAGSPEKQAQCKEKRKHVLVPTPAP
jgi:hypothetical protein